MGTDLPPASAAAAPDDAPASSPDSPPVELCGYPVDSLLSPAGESFLAVGPGGRGVVLKRMPAETIVKGQLHPSIRERLSRVREIAHAGLANLHGVGREGDGAWLIWEYVDGQTFDAYSAAAPRTPRELASFGRELALTLESLHMLGVVHGALSGSNVFLTPRGTVRITHVSPLLYTDPAADADAAVDLLRAAVAQHGGQKGNWPLAKVLDEAAQDGWPLRVLAARLAALIEARQPGRPVASATGHGPDDERKSHRRSVLAALVVLLLGGATAFGVWIAVGQPGRPQIQQWLEPVK